MRGRRPWIATGWLRWSRGGCICAAFPDVSSTRSRWSRSNQVSSGSRSCLGGQRPDSAFLAILTLRKGNPAHGEMKERHW